MNMGNKLLQLWKRPWFEDYKIQAFLNSNWDHKTRYKYPAGLAQLGERQAEEEKKKKKKTPPTPDKNIFWSDQISISKVLRISTFLLLVGG